jgi:hypothetical protein
MPSGGALVETGLPRHERSGAGLMRDHLEKESTNQTGGEPDART